MMKKAPKRTMPWIVVRSERSIDVNRSRPTPGMLNTVSVRIALPASSVPMSRPSRVTIGVIALRIPCRIITARSGTPFARAVRM